ncbi:MAG TPA: asparagine synthase (glutamine-hydrolyzing), partial [Arenibaculum sp.]|nr:asparagine synthase (glutamine-hydrolyzing) [Arenibaculum sp.]
FNGEIYNYRELRRELQDRGHRFATDSDTEVLVHGWEEWGTACVDRLRGMFAFAVFDGRRQELLLVRDRFGIKPLYFAGLPDGWLAFGSELKALLALPAVPRTMDAAAVENYLALGYVPDSGTIYGGVTKLPPGHFALFRPGKETRLTRYWTPAAQRTAVIRPADAEEELRDRLGETVEAHLMSEVPLGAFLSGGIDSSAIVAMMASRSAHPVTTCAIGFDDPDHDETAHADIVARRFATRHHQRTVAAASFTLLDTLANCFDEPFGDSSALPTWQVCALARENVVVALSGDGGDELFWGYLRYRWHADGLRRRRLIPPALAAAGAAALPARTGPGGRIRKTLEALSQDPLTAYYRSVAVIDDATRRRLYRPEFRHRLGGHRAIDVVRRHYEEAPTDHPVGRVQYVDLMTNLPEDLLTKVDRVSMAHGLEVRVPFLDHHLAEWAFGLPPDLKLRGAVGKYVLKKALEPVLPKALLHRRKQGFGVPLDAWFRGPLRDRVRTSLLGPVLSDAGIFDPAAIAGMIDDHQGGRADHGTVLWSLLMFDAFLRVVHESAPTDLAAV